MRDYLRESADVLGVQRPLRDLLTSDKGTLLQLLVKYLDDADVYKRKYAAFCLGQIGDDSVLDSLQAAVGREPEGGARDAMGAALATLKSMASSSGSTEAQRCEYLEETYSKGLPDWVRHLASGSTEKAAPELAGEIFDALTAIKDAAGEPLRILEYQPSWEGHARQFHLSEAGAFAITDPAVVDEARRLAERGDTVRIVSRGAQYVLYARTSGSQTETAEKTKGGCFIATAVCGSAGAPEVVLLSAFRDEVLERHFPGRLLIRAYYRLSPPLAQPLGTSPALRWLTHRLVITPLVRLISLGWFPK